MQDNDLPHTSVIGYTSSSHASGLCALAFGKQEGGSCEILLLQISGLLMAEKFVFDMMFNVADGRFSRVYAGYDRQLARGST